MSSTIGALLLTVSLTGGVAEADKPVLPLSIIQAGLKKAQCSVPSKAAEIVGTELLSPRLQIVEVTCWQTEYNSGSILFAVPVGQPQGAELLSVQSWKDGRVQTAYNVTSPAFDAKTRTISATYKARAAGDCGTIQEMKWTGWHFRLLNVWRKDKCDGEPFEWDSRDKWQVFPQKGLPPDIDGSPGNGGRAEASR
jgi:Protein of unknown function (DUF1176)